jgi:WD40 repeat protein/serine/threonine protein kinase
MAQTFICPENHRWQQGVRDSAEAPERCPVCGAAPAYVAAADGSILGRAEAPSVPSSGAPGDQSPTVLNSSAAPKDASSDPDRTLAPELPAGALAVGRTVNATYEILGELGRGGMGVVYKARQLRLNRLVALKMILSGSHAGAEQLTRFRAEAEVLAPLQHPNIVQVYEVGELDGHPYFSLEFIDGGSLAQVLAGTPQAPRQAAQVVETLARAMHFAHLRGIVHRDLKPANILLAVANIPAAVSGNAKDKTPVTVLTAEPAPLSAFTPKITDFGLAKNLESDSGHTKTGAILGTPSYISPEQASGRKDIGPATDVYSLGAILYELLTGRPPFRGESSMDTMMQVMTEEPVPPRRLQPKIPADLETICLKCLQKEPHKRYPNAEALAEDLKRFLAGEPIQARPIGLYGRTIKFARRRPALAALAALGILAAVTILAGSLYYNAELAKANRREQAKAQALAIEKANADAARNKADEARQVAEREREEADKQRKAAQERLEHQRRTVYAYQLLQAAGLAEREPRQGLELLDDKERCPPEFRDFTWAYLYRLCRRERATLTGSKAPITCVALTADGKTAASTAGDENVLVWDLEGKQPVRPLKTRHAGPVVALAIAPDGQTLATAGFDKTIRLYNLSSGAELAVLEGHSKGPRAVAFSPDGQTLASAGYDRSVILWDVADRKPKATLTGHKGAILSLAFAADSSTLASGSDDRSVRLWDVAAGKELGPPLEGHTGTVLSVAFAPAGRLLASAGADRTIKLWAPSQKMAVQTLRGHLHSVNAVAFSPVGRMLVSASDDGTVKLWDSTTGEARTTFKGHAKPVLSLAFARDGATLASGSADQTIKLWDFRPRADRAPFRVDLGGEPPQPPVTAWTSDGRSLATVNHHDKIVRLWDLAGENERLFLQGFAAKFDSLAISPDGKTLAAGADDQTIRLYEMGNGRLQQTLKAHVGRITCLTFSTDSKLLVSGGADAMVRFWSAADGKELEALPVHQGPLRCLVFAAKGAILAASDGKSVKLWDVTYRKPIADLGPPSAGVRTLAFSPDGKTLAVAASNGVVYLWDVPTRREDIVLKGHQAPVRSLAFSPDGKTLATGHADWNIVLWDPRTGQERATLGGHSHPVYALSFAADGSTLFSVDEDGAVRRWEASAAK